MRNRCCKVSRHNVGDMKNRLRNLNRSYWLTKGPMLPTSKSSLHGRHKIREHERFLLYEKNITNFCDDFDDVRVKQKFGYRRCIQAIMFSALSK